MIICPACKQEREIECFSAFNAKCNEIITKRLILDETDSKELLASYIEESIAKIACDSCIRNERAIIADITKQQFCDFLPYVYYVDTEHKCLDCEKKFTFTKMEKIFWYEEKRFWVQSVPIRCQDCRKAKRDERLTNKIIQELIKKQDKDENDFQILIDFYSEKGNKIKANIWKMKRNKGN
jgi:hypothetical protein